LDFAAFGCALDALDSPERVAMKLAYLGALKTGLIPAGVPLSPYDLMIETLTDTGVVKDAGEVDVPSWLTPRPILEDFELITPARFREFTEGGGLERTATDVAAFVRDEVAPLKPVMISVDHSMTGGVLQALSAPGRELALVLFDAHLDAIPAELRRRAAGTGGEPLPDAYDCGTWLSRAIDLVGPERVVVLGVSDHPGETAAEDEPEGLGAYREAYLSVERSGVTIITKKQLREEGPAALASVLEKLEGKECYFSIDADVAAGESVKAVRFMDSIGLEEELFLDCLEALRGPLGTDGLAGFDITEIDVHLADIRGDDRTMEVMTAAALDLVGAR
jgi:arginase family enzyme